MAQKQDLFEKLRFMAITDTGRPSQEALNHVPWAIRKMLSLGPYTNKILQLSDGTIIRLDWKIPELPRITVQVPEIVSAPQKQEIEEEELERIVPIIELTPDSANEWPFPTIMYVWPKFRSVSFRSKIKNAGSDSVGNYDGTSDKFLMDARAPEIYPSDFVKELPVLTSPPFTANLQAQYFDGKTGHIPDFQYEVGPNVNDPAVQDHVLWRVYHLYLMDRNPPFVNYIESDLIPPGRMDLTIFPPTVYDPDTGLASPVGVGSLYEGTRYNMDDDGFTCVTGSKNYPDKEVWMAIVNEEALSSLIIGIENPSGPWPDYPAWTRTQASSKTDVCLYVHDHRLGLRKFILYSRGESWGGDGPTGVPRPSSYFWNPARVRCCRIYDYHGVPIFAFGIRDIPDRFFLYGYVVRNRLFLSSRINTTLGENYSHPFALPKDVLFGFGQIRMAAWQSKIPLE
jgi:hypothetical protein